MKNVNKVLIALGAGMVIGGVLGVLFAPKKGAELRKDIAEKKNEFSEAMKSKLNQAKEKLNGLRKNKEEFSEEYS
ncbi:MAG: YtxH domain-containing protein [Chitinophagaceae bacterium]